MIIARKIYQTFIIYINVFNLKDFDNDNENNDKANILNKILNDKLFELSNVSNSNDDIFNKRILKIKK